VVIFFPVLFFTYRIEALSIFPIVVRVSPTKSKEQDMQMAFAKLQQEYWEGVY